MFSFFQEHIDAEQSVRDEIRKAVKEIELCSSDIYITLQSIHRNASIEWIAEVCSSSREKLQNVKSGYAKLMTLIPKDEYYRYNDHWRYTTQQLAFLVCLIGFLEKGGLILKDEFSQTIGVHNTRQQGFHVDLDDYLGGVLLLVGELARFSVNSVVFGDYSRPLQISQFVAEINSGFRLLHFKNDSLRKRFDGMKYDVKKIEEVVYDVSLRGLAPKKENGKPKNKTEAPSSDTDSTKPPATTV